MQGSTLAMISTLESAPPHLSEAEARDIAAAYFGLDGQARRLVSERDANFRIEQADGQCFVLKVTNPAEPSSLTDLQTKALLHIEAADPGLPVPRLVSTRDGDHELALDLDGATCIARVLTYLPGQPLHLLDGTSRQRRNIGACLARLGLALKDFSHPEGDHDLLWDIRHASRLRQFTTYIDDTCRRALVESFLERFATEVEPHFPALRAQLVHNDFNPHNILIGHDEAVSGIIDFGDMVLTPLVNDLAIATAYHVCAEGHPLDGIAEMVGAYNEVTPLLPLEIDLLFDLIAARFATTVVITHWRAQCHPANSAYILRNNPRAWLGLERFARLSRCEARAVFAAACAL